MTLQIVNNQLKAENQKLIQELKSSKEFSLQKDMYISELERQKDIMENGDHLKDLE